MATITGVQALSFDCYGTLIDWERGILAVLRPWATRWDLTASDDELLAAHAEAETSAEREHPHEPYPAILQRTMRGIGSRLGAPVDDTQARALATSVPAWPTFPDSPDALARLGARVPLLVLSNVDRTSFAGSNARLGVRFTRVITAEDVGAFKPAPRGFALLRAEAAALGIPAEGLVHVAQSLFHDHVPARAAGLRTAWIDRRHDRPGWGATPPPPAPVTPDWTFPTLTALADALGA